MKKKRVQRVASLALTAPAGLRGRPEVAEASAQSQTDAENIRRGSQELEGGRVTKRFVKVAMSLADRYAASFRKLAK